MKTNRIQPATLRKRLSLGTIWCQNGKALDELFWLETPAPQMKFLVFERGRGIELAFFRYTPGDWLVARGLIQLGLGKQVESEAVAENEARYWYGAYDLTCQLIDIGVLKLDQWLDKTCGPIFAQEVAH